MKASHASGYNQADEQDVGADFYSLLGLTPAASEEEVKTAYRCVQLSALRLSVSVLASDDCSCSQTSLLQPADDVNDPWY